MSQQSYFITALVLSFALMSLAPASGTSPEASGSRNAAALETAANPNASTGFVYFPAQYVNRATESSEHIQAF